MKKSFYVTTPIYYVNDVPHIGHAYTTLAADVLARFHRLNGENVFFLTGTDEHGQKIEQAAIQHGETPIQLADRVVKHFKDLWKFLNISNDDFIRTTEERHKKVVTTLMKKVIDKGDIYLGTYEDWYCVPCEAFYTETQLVNAKCPTCGREVKKLKEESYFFKMSKYQEPLLEHLEKNKSWIEPESRRNEVLSFVREGLRDLSISRTTFGWGIPMPTFKKTQQTHIIYVWFDALINYLTGIGYLDNPIQFKTFWPETLHLIGKDILRFHAIYWPTMLLSMDLALPKKIVAHGWWTHEGEKISKSKGNVIDPTEVVKIVGLDQFRYFILREVPFGLDGDFSQEALKNRINSDLANDLGNLLSRTTKMVEKYCDGKVPSPAFAGATLKKDPLDQEMIDTAKMVTQETIQYLNDISFSKALTSIWKLIRFSNQYLEKKSPWKLFKDGKIKEVGQTLYYCLESLRISSLLTASFMPDASEKIWKSIGGEGALSDQLLSQSTTWGKLKPGRAVTSEGPLFPRLEEK